MEADHLLPQATDQPRMSMAGRSRTPRRPASHCGRWWHSGSMTDAGPRRARVRAPELIGEGGWLYEAEHGAAVDAVERVRGRASGARRPRGGRRHRALTHPGAQPAITDAVPHISAMAASCDDAPSDSDSAAGANEYPACHVHPAGPGCAGPPHRERGGPAAAGPEGMDAEQARGAGNVGQGYGLLTPRTRRCSRRGGDGGGPPRR